MFAYHCDSPILVIVYNRPIQTARVLEMVGAVRPSRVYIASDGPKDASDAEKVDSVRAITSALPASSNVKHLISKRNLGCRNATEAAIDWFFEYETAGIILEDDTVPNLSFFRFCDELLQRYSNDSRIGSIQGSNSVFQGFEHSYCFSVNRASWGWATWKRAWQLHDRRMDWRGTGQSKDVMNRLSATGKSRAHWIDAMEWMDRGVVDTWDWPWQLSLISQNMLSIFPRENLVANIGFGEGATHTKTPSKYDVASTTEICFPLHHPALVVPEKDFDRALELRYVQGARHRAIRIVKRSLPRGATTGIKSLRRSFTRLLSWMKR